MFFFAQNQKTNKLSIDNTSCFVKNGKVKVFYATLFREGKIHRKERIGRDESVSYFRGRNGF